MKLPYNPKIKIDFWETTPIMIAGIETDNTLVLMDLLTRTYFFMPQNTNDIERAEKVLDLIELSVTTPTITLYWKNNEDNWEETDIFTYDSLREYGRTKSKIELFDLDLLEISIIRLNTVNEYLNLVNNPENYYSLMVEKIASKDKWRIIKTIK